MTQISDRRSFSKKQIELLTKNLGKANAILEQKACAYATGSFGRHEANQYSDLDLFMVAKSNDRSEALLGRLDEICVKAELISAARKIKLPDFDADGKYLTLHTVEDLIKTLGKPEDDANNTFTARLLLLLESTPLVENHVYKSVIEDVIAAYWEDYSNHKEDFVPAFFTNDVLRLWRTFCVNYEANTQRDPADKLTKRRIKHFKLSYSRMLTCYSAILYLIAIYKRHSTVSPEDGVSMALLAPCNRLEWLIFEGFDKDKNIKRLLDLYDRFLDSVAVSEDKLMEIFSDSDKRRDHIGDARIFGDTMFAALQSLDGASSFYRKIIV